MEFTACAHLSHPDDQGELVRLRWKLAEAEAMISDYKALTDKVLDENDRLRRWASRRA